MGLRQRLRPEWFKTFRKLVVARTKLARARRRLGLPPISGNPLAAIKTSDTLFVLGSGGSINQISAPEWAAIGKADTVGLNFWLLHDFVPKAYVFEPPKDPVDRAAILNNLKARSADYRDTLLFMKDGERFREDDLNDFLDEVVRATGPRIVMAWDWELREETLEGFTAQIKRLDRHGMLTSPRMPFPRKRASIFYIVLMALRAGYRRIVLCGVDLNQSPYFYENRRGELQARGLQVPEPPPPSDTHITDDPSYGTITITSSLAVLRDRVLAPRGVELRVAFESSKLFPMLPSHFGRP
jgi:hypothetical protein